jgi:hypothetical protein
VLCLKREHPKPWNFASVRECSKSILMSRRNELSSFARLGSDFKVCHFVFQIKIDITLILKFQRLKSDTSTTAYGVDRIVIRRIICLLVVSDWDNVSAAGRLVWAQKPFRNLEYTIKCVFAVLN